MKYTLAAVAALTGVLLAVPTADAGNCHVGFNRSYVVQQQAYVAPAFQAYGYTQAVPYAVPTVILPDTMYRVDSALAYARIAEAAAEAAANKVNSQQTQQLLQMFNDFLKQQAQLQQWQKIPPASGFPPDAPPNKGIIEHGKMPVEVPKAELPAVPAPSGKQTNQTPAMVVNELLVHTCVSCHKPNTKRTDLTADSATFTKAQLDEIMHRIMAPDDDEGVMPPKTHWKGQRPTTIAHINAVHALRKTAK